MQVKNTNEFNFLEDIFILRLNSSQLMEQHLHLVHNRHQSHEITDNSTTRIALEFFKKKRKFGFHKEMGTTA